MKQVICFGAHPDDIELSMAGTVRQFVLNGYAVSIVIGCIPNEVERRIQEAEKAANILGANVIFVEAGLGRNTGAMTQPELVKETDRIIKEIKPDLIFTHWDQDPHEDHVALTKAVLASARLTTADLYLYAPPNWDIYNANHFVPNAFQDITNEWSAKEQSILVHFSQLGKKGRSHWIEKVKLQNRWLGELCKTEYAEGFILLRKQSLI